MIIGKYNIPVGSGSRPSAGATAVSGGGGVTVDLTPITDKVATLEAEVSQLRLQLTKLQTAMAGLDSKFLSKLGDRSEYAYALGSLYTDFIQSNMFDDGVGFRVSGSATATVDDKYNLVIKDVGWASIPFNTVQQSTASIVDSNTDEATAQLVTQDISIGATSAAGYLLVDCGADLTNERCFTVISKRVLYTVRTTIGQQSWIDRDIEAETDSNGNFILFFEAADNITVTIKFLYTYAFRQVGDITSGTYRLYIRGTDYANNQTDCFAASLKSATLNASGLTVLNGNNGKRFTSSGVQTTTDWGNTWT